MDIKTLKSPCEPAGVNAMYQVAEDIKNGGAGDRFVYCLEGSKFYIYLNGYWKELHEEQMMLKIELEYPYINKFPAQTKIQVIKQLKILIHKELKEFNKQDLLNFEQGMFDPKGNNVSEHAHHYLSTIRLPYKYDKTAECPLWINTLEGIFEGDKNKIDMLQEYLGSCLTREVIYEKSLLLLGESRSGKSTILETISNLFGESNVSSVALENLSNSQYTDLLVNKMVNIDWDVASGAEKFEANFKIITSGEPVNVNQKYVKPFTFRPYCKLILAANKFPRITDHSSAFYKRLILLPCDKQFAPEEQNLKLKKQLKEELSGIFNWAVSGLIRLQERGGFELTKEFMTDAISDLREESNPIEAFFKEFIETENITGESQIEKQDLYTKYTKWCIENGNSPMSMIKFGQAVYQKYSKFTEKKSQCHKTGKRIWRNIKYINNLKTKEDLGWNGN